MPTEIKMVPYSLYENKLRDQSEEGRKYYARIKARGTVKQKHLVEMITKRNSTVTPQEVTAVLALLEEVIKDSLQMGYNVHTGIFNTRMALKGVFEKTGDEFDKSRHSLVLQIKPSVDLKAFMEKEVTLEKAETVLPGPALTTVYDYDSKTENLGLTPDSYIDLDGRSFFFDPEDERQSVFFINSESGERFKTDWIKKWTAKTIVCHVPANLPAGSYTVQVACGYGSIIRTADLQDRVTVA